MTITGVCLAWRTLGFPRQMHGRGGGVQEGFTLAAVCGYLTDKSSKSWTNNNSQKCFGFLWRVCVSG
jgi:hypothetical protein